MSRRQISHRHNAMSLVDVVVCVTFAGLLVVIALVVVGNLGTPHVGHRAMQNSTLIRGVHQGMVLFSQGNNGWYPGIASASTSTNVTVNLPTVAERIKPLIDGNFFTPNYAVSPVESDPSITAWTSGPFTASHYSYAFLSLSTPGQRQTEWRDNTNPQAAIGSDRNLGPDANQNVQSIWTTKPGQWQGSVVFGDNSAQFEKSHTSLTTKYGTTVTKNDNLFDASGGGGDDALMVHEEPTTQPASP